MCGASPPKPPKVKKINPFQGAMSDPRVARAASELEIRDISNDDDMRRVTEFINKEDFELERDDRNFREAERQLYAEGALSGLREMDGLYDGKRTDRQIRFKQKHLREFGEDADWKYAYGQENFKYENQADLQKVYDRQAEIETDRYNEKADNKLKRTEKRYIQQQKNQTKKNNAELDKRQEQMLIAQREAEDRQADLMREMANQPVYQPRQAALPKVQAKPKTPKPMPVAPAPPPTMSISTAPAPELVNVGNPMNIVKQSSTSRSRARGRNKGTSSLT